MLERVRCEPHHGVAGMGSRAGAGDDLAAADLYAEALMDLRPGIIGCGTGRRIRRH